jgi:hypothetical protein
MSVFVLIVERGMKFTLGMTLDVSMVYGRFVKYAVFSTGLVVMLIGLVIWLQGLFSALVMDLPSHLPPSTCTSTLTTPYCSRKDGVSLAALCLLNVLVFSLLRFYA